MILAIAVSSLRLDNVPDVWRQRIRNVERENRFQLVWAHGHDCGDPNAHRFVAYWNNRVPGRAFSQAPKYFIMLVHRNNFEPCAARIDGSYACTIDRGTWQPTRQ
jgi:hypothetical protein